MKHYLILGSAAVLSLGLLVAACGDSETTAATTINPTTTTGGTGGTGGNTGGGGSGATGGGGNGVPELPVLGAQIDRLGRPAINTATTKTFTADATRATAEAAYNANSDTTTWSDDYVADIAASLAILDSLDGTCSLLAGTAGDQAFYGALGNPNYLTLATVLSQDWLLIDSTETTCGYLGVELTLAGGAASCGGRQPSEDVMDATYGAVSGAAGFGDTIAAGPQSQVTTFPYLAAPN